MVRNKQQPEPRRSRVPWADQAVPVAGVPSGVHVVRDDTGKLHEVIVPFLARREVKQEVPAGFEAVHLIALATVDYANALRQLLRESSTVHEDRHANTLLCALASLEGALFQMDRTAFAAVGEAPRRADGRRTISAHDAVINVLGWCVSLALRALQGLERKGETPLEFFTRLDPERFARAASVVPRLREVVDQLDPTAELADWSSAKVLLQREVAQLRAAAEATEKARVPPLNMTIMQRVLWVCRDGDARGFKKCTQIQKAIGAMEVDGAGVRRNVRKAINAGYLEDPEKAPHGCYRTTAKGLALLPSVSNRHTP